jgi:hypothetical protein
MEIPSFASQYTSFHTNRSCILRILWLPQRREQYLSSWCDMNGVKRARVRKSAPRIHVRIQPYSCRTIAMRYIEN